MEVIHTVAELRKYLQGVPNNVFVPTMGNLHEGHLRLVEEAAPRGACTVVSIFVNRLQFGPREDFDRYPRTLADDCRKLESIDCDVVFAPDEQELYPEPQTYTVQPSGIEDILEGAVRPGHFRGVATVVLEALQHGAAACRGVRQEGLPAVSGAADDGAATGAAGRDHPAETVRGGRPGTVVAQPVSVCRLSAQRHLVSIACCRKCATRCAPAHTHGRRSRPRR